MEDDIQVLLVTLTPERIAGLLWSSFIEGDVITENNKVYIDSMKLVGDELDVVLRITAKNLN